MRTTMKRGMGRGAALDGNGRAVLPPSAVSPIRLYRQPPPPRRSRWRVAGRVLGWIGTMLLMLVAGLGGGLYLYGHEAVAEIQARTPEVKIAQTKLEVPTAGKPATALVIGYDQRFKGPEAGGASRSDTIMLVRADPTTKSISMLSFPRDLVVDIRCPRRGPFRNRINQAFTTCGPIGVVETVKAATGLSINYLITVNFRGFIKVVDRLGGTWVDVDRRYFNDSGLYSAINLHPLRDGTFDACLRDGLTPLVWSPLAGGRLATGEGVRPELVALLDDLAARESVDRATIALAFALAHPSRPVAIIGTQRPERIAEAGRARDVTLDRADVYAIIQASEGVPLP